MLADLETAPIGEGLRATLRLLRKVTRAHGEVTPEDMKEVLRTGVTPAQIKDALAVCFSFNVITRLADTFEFHVGPREHFDIGAKALLSRGYR